MRATSKISWAALALLALCLGQPAWAQDAKIGRQKAQQCIVCHGSNGLSTQPDAPHLAGQPAFYLLAQLKAYQSGERRHEVMSMMAKSLAAEDLPHVAAWFASIKIEAHIPR